MQIHISLTLSVFNTYIQMPSFRVAGGLYTVSLDLMAVYLQLFFLGLVASLATLMIKLCGRVE